MTYWILIAVIIVLICIIVYIVRKLMKADSSTDLSATMITSGIALIASAFPGIKEMLASVIAACFGVQIDLETDYVAIVCGFALIIIGILYSRTIRDRIFVLNMLGMFSQLEISDLRHIKQLKLADFKVKEILIDFVDVFRSGNMSTEKNQIIVSKIKKQCAAFKARSADFKACFTGMAPIPYTILAGYYLSGGSIRRFFEYKATNNEYIELTRKSKQKKFPLMQAEYLEPQGNTATDLTVTVSITMPVQDSDIAQFHYDVVKLGLKQPKNNIIASIDQLENYCDFITTELENTKLHYPNLQRIHLLASVPSCVSEKLGEQLSLRSNRLPQVIAYHYTKGSQPCYPFGIIVSDISSEKVGTLVLPEKR